MALVCAFVFTGFVSAAYQRERVRLGQEHFDDGQKMSAESQYGDAAEEFRKALLYTPDSNDYRLALATALVKAGKLEEAESHLEQLAQEDPTNGRINLLLARIALQQHKTNQAIDSYQRAVYEYWPPDEIAKRRQARWELIQLLEQQPKRHNDLIGELLQFYGNLPPASSQRLLVGQTLLKNGAEAEAATVFRDVLKSAPQDPTAHEGLALVAFRAGDYLTARHEYQRTLRSAPNDQDAEKGLQLTNEIIDISPQLPNISAEERLRRSGNLLGRVKNALQTCAVTPANDAALQQTFADVENALKPQKKDADDQAAKLQFMAADIWHGRAALCNGTAPNDQAIETVLTRLAHE